MRRPRLEKLLRVASVLGLIALGLIVWALFDPGPWAIIVAMSIGQGLGTIAFGILIVGILSEMRRRERQGTLSTTPPPPKKDP